MDYFFHICGQGRTTLHTKEMHPIICVALVVLVPLIELVHHAFHVEPAHDDLLVGGVGHQLVQHRVGKISKRGF